MMAMTAKGPTTCRRHGILHPHVPFTYKPATVHLVLDPIALVLRLTTHAS